jgi:hypothetical protein
MEATLAQPVPLVVDHGDKPTVTFHWLRRTVCPDGFKDGRALTYITLLIDQRGFPPPLPTMVLGRGEKPSRLVDGVCSASMWSRAAVEAWLDDQLPPGTAAAIDRRAQAAAATEMDGAAFHLQLINGGRA